VIERIPARIFVTDSLNSPGCLAGHPTVITDPPWELAGQFLTGLDTGRNWLLQRLPRFLRECASGKRDEYKGGTECFDLTIKGESVRLETVYVEPPASCDLPVEPFLRLVQDWREFVRRCERSPGMEALLAELEPLLYGYNFQVFLRAYRVPFASGDSNGGFGVVYPGDVDAYDRQVDGVRIPERFVPVYGFWGLPTATRSWCPNRSIWPHL
jgi:hypothetical protein